MSGLDSQAARDLAAQLNKAGTSRVTMIEWRNVPEGFDPLDPPEQT